MSFPGLGDADWVELDLDGFELDRDLDVRRLVEAAAPSIERLVGPAYRLEPVGDGTLRVVVDDHPRFHARATATGRLVLTARLDPEGPL